MNKKSQKFQSINYNAEDLLNQYSDKNVTTLQHLHY